MANYSYKPARYGVGQIGKQKHATATKHTIKLYTQDAKIVKQHRDALLKAKTDWTGGVKGTTAPIVKNPGNKESLEMEAMIMDPCQIEAVYTHGKMGDFHEARTMLLMDMARQHTLNDFQRSREAAPTLELSPVTGKLPSLFDVQMDGNCHDCSCAMEYHAGLHADSVMEAEEYRKAAELMRTEMNMLPIEAVDKVQDLKESIQVCGEYYNFFNKVAELHSMYANDFSGFLKRKADATFNRDSSPEPVHQIGL